MGPAGPSTNTSVAISASAQGAASAGDLWYDSDDGDLHVYYNDGSSSQWVNTSGAGAKGEKGAQGATDLKVHMVLKDTRFLKEQQDSIW